MNGISWFRYADGTVEIETDAGVFLCVTKRFGGTSLRLWYSCPTREPQPTSVVRRLESELVELYAQDEQRYEPRGDVVEAVAG